MRGGISTLIMWQIPPHVFYILGVYCQNKLYIPKISEKNYCTLSKKHIYWIKYRVVNFV